MSFYKEAKEQEEIRKKKNRIRIATWIIIAIALVSVWYFTK